MIVEIMVQLSEFSVQVLKNIKAIPAGKVATYKQIAELSGKPQGARGVAWLLHSCSTVYKLPWHRVLNSRGRISFEPQTHNFKSQLKRLKAEGVEITKDGHLDLKKFGWQKRKKIKFKKNQPKLFSKS